MPRAQRQYQEYKLTEQHSKLLDWLYDAENSIPETRWREEAIEDYKFYAGHQDSDEVLKLLAEQQRPAPVFNEVKPKVDMLIGMAGQTKWDIHLLPHGQEDESLAELASALLKYFRDKEHFVDKETDVFTHTVKSGRSFIYFYIDKQNPFQPVVKAKRYPGEHVYVDPDSIEYDLSDARYVHIEKWLTEEEMERYWPDIDLPYLRGEQYYNGKLMFFNEVSDRYRVIECWHKRYEKRLWFIDPVTGKETSLLPKEFATYSRQLREGIEIHGQLVKFEEELRAYEAWKEVIWVTIFSGYYVIEEAKSPYNMEHFPIVMCGAYHCDDENIWFSVINQMKDPQRAKNTLNRQLLHLLQTLPKGMLVHEAGAVLNIEEYEERSADPAFHLQLSQGGLSRVMFQQQPAISPLYGQLDQIYGQAMKDASGIQNEMMGVQTTSREPGVSVRARQETGIAVLFVLFDNYRRFRKRAAEIYFRLLQQYVTDPLVFRIMGDRGQQLYQINTQTNPQVEGWNDITAVDFDLILDDAVYTASMRNVVAQILTEYSHNNPGTVPPDLVLEYSGVPFTAKQKMMQFFKMQQQAAAETAQKEQALQEAELELKQKELEIKQAEALIQRETAQGKLEVEKSKAKKEKKSE